MSTWQGQPDFAKPLPANSLKTPKFRYHDFPTKANYTKKSNKLVREAPNVAI